ncbi:MAG: iron-sulfur cluster assembly accessory protein [Anaerolineales bacterium]|nr:iron-sulfur cluster assembly accessory protein [Anaerolineales bacterium]
MFEKVDSQTISITPAAAEAVRNVLTQRNLEGYALRIYIAGNGCKGPQFGMALDNNIKDTDLTIESNGISVVIDDITINYLKDASIDYINDPQYGAGFIVNSPHNQAAGGCSCDSGCSC